MGRHHRYDAVERFPAEQVRLREVQPQVGAVQDFLHAGKALKDVHCIVDCEVQPCWSTTTQSSAS